jgi:hypothetical protein
VRELAEAIIDADKPLRMTQQGLPALRFESGDYTAATSITGGHAEGNASGMAVLHTTGSHATVGSLGTTHPPGTLPPLTLTQHAAAAATIAPPEPAAAAVVAAPSVASEPAFGETDAPRSNPYRMFTVLLLLIVLGLGAAIYYLLQRMAPGADSGPETADLTAHDPTTPPTLPDSEHPPDPTAPVGDPTAADGKDPKPTKKHDPVKKPDPGKKTPPAGTIDVTQDDIQSYIKTLLADVTRCASTNNVARQRVTIYIEAEAGTGKVHPTVENPRDNAAFVSCAEKSVLRKKFKKGRKLANFRAQLDI